MPLKSTDTGGLQWHHCFWDWHHEKLIPTQFKIHIFCHVKTKIAFLSHCTLSSAISKQKKQPKQFWKSQVWQRFRLIGDEFFMISISKTMVPLLFPGFLVYVAKFGRVLVVCEKHLYVVSCPTKTKNIWRYLVHT